MQITLYKNKLWCTGSWKRINPLKKVHVHLQSLKQPFITKWLSDHSRNWFSDKGSTGHGMQVNHFLGFPYTLGDLEFVHVIQLAI